MSTEDPPLHLEPALGSSSRPRGLPLSEILTAIATDTTRERISVGDLLFFMQDRALAALVFLFAFPNVLPLPPGASVVIGLPLVFLTAQRAFGLRPWLPQLITRRSMLRKDYAALVRRIAPWLARAERMLKPRLTALARPPFEYAIGVVCLVLAILVTLPVPLSNIGPAFAICLLSLGLLERDGVWVMAGLAAAAAAGTLVSGVVYALIKSALFLIGIAAD
jgi:hypothetical protein